MGKVLNLDVVAVETVEITKRGKTYVLRDDVPAEILLQRLAMTPERYITITTETEGDPTEEEIDTALDGIAAYKADVTHLAGEIFRWSLPETTDEELAVFSIEELQQIIQLFTMRRGETSSTLPGATPAPKRRAIPPARPGSRRRS